MVARNHLLFAFSDSKNDLGEKKMITKKKSLFLSTEAFVGKTGKARIARNSDEDCLEVEQRKKKNNDSFPVYILSIVYEGENRKLGGLMESALFPLNDEWSEESTEWIGNCIEFSVVENPKSGFKNWMLKPIPEFQEEDLGIDGKHDRR